MAAFLRRRRSSSQGSSQVVRILCPSRTSNIRPQRSARSPRPCVGSSLRHRRFQSLQIGPSAAHVERPSGGPDEMWAEICDKAQEPPQASPGCTTPEHHVNAGKKHGKLGRPSRLSVGVDLLKSTKVAEADITPPSIRSTGGRRCHPAPASASPCGPSVSGRAQGPGLPH